MTSSSHPPPPGPEDFTGYWRLVKTENFNNFLKDLGLPWTVRKVRLPPECWD